VTAYSKCEQCRRLWEEYWKAIVAVVRVEGLKSRLGTVAEEVAQTLATHLEMFELARKVARDALITHQIEKPHS
jgi:hypothetical protein